MHLLNIFFQYIFQAQTLISKILNLKFYEISEYTQPSVDNHLETIAFDLTDITRAT
jgi:hypothetical protein